MKSTLKIAKKSQIKALAVVIIVSMILPLFSLGTTAANPIDVYAESPAIAVAKIDNTPINLADYQYVKGSVKTPFTDYTWKSDDVTVADNKLTPQKSGVFKLVGTKGSDSINIYVVAKEEKDTDYILYSEDFSNFEVSKYTTVKGSASCTDGKLDLTPGTVVLLPEFLGDFGDYKYEVSATIKNPANTGRWGSVMYRVENNNLPYYQMCVRSDATASNGVEFAEMTTSGQWNVTKTASFTEALDPNKFYTLAVSANGSKVEESINGKVLISNPDATAHLKGRLGLQSNGCNFVIDSVKVSLQTEAAVRPVIKPGFVDTRDVESNLITTPSLVTYCDTKEIFDNIQNNSPATAVVYVNDNGEVTDKNGAKIATLDELFAKLDGKVIPGFIPASKAAVDKLAEYLTSKECDDATVLSSDAAVLKYARSKFMMFRGALLLGEDAFKDRSATKVRELVHLSNSKIAVLPSSLATKDNVQALQKLLITVWVQSDGNESDAGVMKLILSGANGIVVNDRAKAESCFKKYFKENSFSRTVWVIGHRGVPSLAPENTVEGSVLAAEKGANIIENDIYLTKDNVIMVLHDGSLERTTNATGNIENYTYAELKDVLVDTNPDFPTAKLPTLEDYFKAFKGTDTFMFVEIKSGKEQIVTELKKLIEKYQIADQVCIISFTAAQCKLVNKLIPELSTGFLCSGITSESDLSNSLRKALTATQEYSTTFNQSYFGMSKDFIVEAGHRGVTVWPWTYTNIADFDKYYFYGTHGLTTNFSQWVENTSQFIISDKYDYEVNPGGTVQFDVKVKSYTDKVTALDASKNMVIISGQDVATFDGTKFTANKEGTVSFFYQYETQLNNKKFYITSPLYTINVVKEQPAVSEDGKGGTNSLTWLYILIGVIGVGGLGLGVFTFIQKNKK